MTHRARRPLDLCLISLCIFILSCGGGGGGGGSGPTVNPIPYTGKTTPAAVTQSNAERIAAGAFFGPDFSADDFSVFRSSAPPDPAKLHKRFSPLMLAKTASKAADGMSAHIAPKIVEDKWREGGACGGYADYVIRISDVTGDFTGGVSFASYDDCDYALTGSMDMAGHINLSMVYPTWMELGTNLLTALSDEGSSSMSGTIRMDFTVYPIPMTMNMKMRNDTSGEVFWYENYVVTQGMFGSDLETTITGRYYDPAHGKVDLSTPQTFRTNYAGLWPYEGTLLLTGASGSRARLTAFDQYTYLVEADADGNGAYEYVADTAHWPGANRAPYCMVEADAAGNVGCPATLSASASDDDGDPLTYSWRIVSAPAGSTAAITGTTLADASFTPDVKGSYVFEVSVNDGYGTTTAQTGTMTVQGGLFCSGNAQGKVDVGSQATAVAVGDVNGDGRDDVVFVTGFYDSAATDGKLFVMLQDSSGNLFQPASYALDSGYSKRPASVAVGDIDGDGRNDIAVGLDRYGIQVFLQNQSGGLDTPQLLTSWDSTCVRIGDLDNDGYKDIAGAGWSSGAVTVWYSGDLGNPATYPVDHGGRDDLELADFTGDGRTDLVIMSGQGVTADLGVLVQNTSGVLTSPAYYDFGGTIVPVGTAAADLNGDGKTDLAVSSSGWISVLPQTVSGTLGTSDSYPFIDGGSGDIVAGDFNSDGRIDLAACYGEAGFGVFLQKQDGTLDAYDYYTLPPTGAVGYGIPLAAGDINGDGKTDIVGGLWRGVIILKGKGGQGN